MTQFGEDDTASDMEYDQAQCRAEAQLSLPGGYGQLGLYYSTSSRRRVYGISESLEGVHEYGIRYNVGSTGNKAGLGLAFEYLRREARAVDPLGHWRLSLTYKPENGDNRQSSEPKKLWPEPETKTQHFYQNEFGRLVAVGPSTSIPFQP
jgi:hypothetical protein